MDPPTSPAAAASRMVWAQVPGSSPNPFSRAAETGNEVASTIARAFASVSARPIAPSASGRPMENANPALVVASASNPSAVSTLAEPASQGLGIANIPGRAWRDLNASPRIVCDSMALTQAGAHVEGDMHAQRRTKRFQSGQSRSFQEARRRLQSKLLEQLAHFSSFFGRIDLCLFRILRPEENVTIVTLRYTDVLTQLLFLTFAQLEDGKLYAFPLAFVRSDTIRVEQFQGTCPALLGKACSNRGDYVFAGMRHVVIFAASRRRSVARLDVVVLDDLGPARDLLADDRKSVV